MKSYSIRYRFTQPFGVPAAMAYEWCTDFKPDDIARMGMKGTRKVERLNDDTIILTDKLQGEREGKRRLVRLNPDRLSWTSTHLTGSNRFSQFWYRIDPNGPDESRLEFTGLQVNYGEPPALARIAEMANELAIVDSGDWLLLAKEMHKELRESGRRK